MQPWLRRAGATLIGVVILVGLSYVLPATGRPHRGRAVPEIVSLSSRWVSAVANRDAGLVDLLDSGALEHYRRLRDLALQGDASALDALHPTDQLQVLFLRLTIDAGRLRKMSAREVLLLAIEQQWIGQDLRRSDTLREVSLEGDTATGRLYKFGRNDRPDRGRQYFTRENGEWRVDLRGERERLRMDFEAFVARSGLVPSEAAFFILETRLLRKVMPADFLPPSSAGETRSPAEFVPKAPVSDAQIRIISVRESPDDPSLAAVTIEDRKESLRFVVALDESSQAESGYRLVQFSGSRVWLEHDGAPLVLAFEREGPALDQRLEADEGPRAISSLVEQARLGEGREGLMAQWRNVGLRGRPQLLQQAWLVPELAPSREVMTGLRVRKLVEGSFWHQLGLSQGDLLEQVNGESMDSMARWQQLLRAAETEREISVVVRRDGRKLRFHTKTVPPHTVR